jgi:CRISPR/Cas system-associated endonuclease Cas1
MHEKKALRGINPGFALDHMEPMRPVVDRAVLQLINTATFTGADFSKSLSNESGACAESGAAHLGALRNRSQMQAARRFPAYALRHAGHAVAAAVLGPKSHSAATGGPEQ